MLYKYNKRCAKCNEVYFTKLISDEQYLNIADNPSISTSFDKDTYVAEIKSTCEECANK